MSDNQQNPPKTLRSRDIEATITFLPTEQGGRKTPAYWGYRPQFYYDGHDWDAAHEYPEVESAKPGDTVHAYLQFLSPEEHVGKLHVGKPFLIREGQHVVAYGVVTGILELRNSAVVMGEKKRNRS